ncbi:MAG: Fic family protein [bacterium]
MNSFKRTEKEIDLPLGAVWLMNSISEYKGKQELYKKQSSQIINSLVEMALIESAESSNRIEGVTVERKRLKPLIIDRTKPRDRSEEEVAGYRNALDLIHKKYKTLEITPMTIKELHRLSHAETGDAGEWKEINNDIIRKNPDGSVEVIFKPVDAKDTPAAIEELCLLYRHSLDQMKYPPLYAVGCLILDFLCIHPFRDGNGRVSRLLTLLVLYHHGYEVGRYISLERIIEQSKETYYEALQKSSLKWHEVKHDISPWLHYFLGTVHSAYKEFEQRASSIKSTKGAKTEIVMQMINSQQGEFSMSDIERLCPGISRDMIRLLFRQMKKEGKITCLGKGQSAKWKRIGE